jgi:hypothetical protein
MAAIFGWEGEVEDPEAVKAGWDAAEAATNRRFDLDLAALDDGDRAELVELINQAHSTKH